MARSKARIRSANQYPGDGGEEAAENIGIPEAAHDSCPQAVTASRC